jgi:hypothetical protein
MPGKRLFNKKIRIMKNIKNCLIAILVLLIWININAQQRNSTIAFDKVDHDFGKFKEEDGNVSHEFIFTNTGNEPLIINRVVSSCGCTATNWTKEPVVPGGKGYVKAEYNPRNRPGKFNKTVTVFTNTQQRTIILRITGDVIPRPKTVKDIYPYSIGGMRFKSNHLAFVKINQGQQKTVMMEMINNSEDKITLSFIQVPAHITIKASPETLTPKQKGFIEATYDAGKKNDWGFVVDRIQVLLSGKTEKNNQLTISATIEEDFSGLTSEELANAPKIEFENTTFDFGTLKQKSSASYEFVFKNAGKRDLFIRKIKSSCGCTAVSPKETVIKSGQSSSIKAVFSSGTRVGKQNKTITVITNDPQKSMIILRLTGQVEAPKAN